MSKQCTCVSRGRKVVCRLQEWERERERMPPRFDPGMIERAVKVCKAECRMTRPDSGSAVEGER